MSSLYTFLAVASAVYLWRWLKSRNDKLSNIPAIGPTAPVLYYWGVFQYYTRGADVLEEACRKYPGRPFRVPLLHRWFVIVNGTQFLDDMRRATDAQLSFYSTAIDELELRHLLDPGAVDSDRSPAVFRVLSKKVPQYFTSIHDEVIVACNDYIGKAEDWTALPAFNFVAKAVARAGNRAAVGLPMCRQPDYVELARRIPIDFLLGAQKIHLLPNFLKRLAGPYLTNVPADADEAIRHTGPEIQRRLDLIAEHGLNYPGKPDDLLSIIIDLRRAEHRTLRDVAISLMSFSLASVQNMSMMVTHALYHLAVRPDVVKELREEIENVTQAEGFSAQAFDKMYKLDSHFKEILRMYSMGNFPLRRTAEQDLLLSDGTLIPQGTLLGMAAFQLQSDSKYYESPEVFDSFRFSRRRESENMSAKEVAKTEMTSTGTDDFMAFGFGRHVCPGRFYAATFAKIITCHLLSHYDIKMENEGVIPAYMQFMNIQVPGPTAKVLFRSRREKT